MRTKLLFTNILLALALPLAPTGARADSETGAANITIGSTAVFSGTSGLLYGASSLVQSLAATVTAGGSAGLSSAGEVFNKTDFGMASANWGTQLSFNQNVELVLTKDGGGNKVGNANLALVNLDTGGGWGHALEIYTVQPGTGLFELATYIDTAGIYYSRQNMVISGTTSTGAGTGGQYGGGYAIVPPNNYYTSMYACWADVIGACYYARDASNTAGVLSFAGADYNGVFRVGLDARNSQVIFGATTITGSGQVFTGDTFIGRVAAANIRIGGADTASPVAQTISFQNVLAGTSNTAGVNTIFQASAGTGTGAGGSFLFQTAPAGTSGTTQNAFNTALTIDGLSGVTINANNAGYPQLTFPAASGNGFGISSNYYGGSELQFWSNNSGITGSWAQVAGVIGSGYATPVNGGYCITNGTLTGATDTCLWRAAAGEYSIGNSTSGDYSGSLKLASLTATGSPPTVASGQIGYGGTVHAPGAGNCPSSAVTGCAVVNVAGTSRDIPYY